MIYKFLTGGAPPLVSFTPVVYSGQEASATAASSSKADKSDEKLEKLQNHADKYFKELTDSVDVLDNDNVTLLRLWLLIEDYIKMYELSGVAIDTAQVRLMYGKVIWRAKMAKVHKKDYDNARTYLQNNGGINEVVTTSNGLLFTYNKETNDYKYMRPEEWTPDSGYRPLTNSDLLYLRNKDISMTLDSDVFRLLELGIGMKTILEYINSMTGNIGATEITKHGYSATQAGQITQGIQLLQEAASKGLIKDGTDFSIEGLYKNKIFNKDLAQLALLALLYVYSTLPDNMKTVLKMKTGNHTDEGALKVLMSFIGSKLSPKYEFDTTYLSDLNPDGTKKGANKDGTDIKASQIVNMQNGLGGSDFGMTVDRGDGFNMQIAGTYYAGVTDKDGKPITDTSLQQMLSQSGLMQIVSNSRNITFGDLAISPELLKNITYNNTGVVRANLPIKDGKIDFSVLEKWKEAWTKIHMSKNPKDPKVLGAILKECGLNDYVLPSGVINTKKVGEFIVTEGYTTSANGIEDSKFVKRIKDQDKGVEIIKKTLTTGTGKDKEVPDIDDFNWYVPDDWLGYYDKVYKAAIYIPITNNLGAAAWADKLSIDRDESDKYEAMYQQWLRNYGLGNLPNPNTDSSLLNINK